MLLACLGPVAVVLPAPGQPATGQDDPIFTVSGVQVDETAATAARARENALAAGQAKALDRLFRRLTPRYEHGRLPVPDPRQAALLVRDFAIDGERTSDVRYLATMTYRFRREPVRRVLREAGIDFTETVSQPALVLPVLMRVDGQRLWDSPNPWLDAWARLDLNGRLTPVIVPLGDLADMADITARQAVAGDRAAIQAITARYGSRDALVAIASLSETAAGPIRTDIAVTRMGANSLPPVTRSFPARPDETVAALLDRAAAAAADAVEDAWINANLLQFGHEQSIELTVPLESLETWIAVRDRLDRVPVVAGMRLVTLRRDRADITLSYFGDVAQLSASLAQRDLQLEAVPPWSAPAAPGESAAAARRYLRLATSAPPAASPRPGNR